MQSGNERGKMPALSLPIPHAMKTITLWDLPTRIFHWTLLACVAGAFATGLTGGGLMDWHGRLGYVVAGLLAFRLVWGLVGATHSRFLTFLPSPSSVIAYLRGRWNGVGHNPLGAFSVFGMLAVLLFQVGTGLFANDDIAFTGPYNILVSKDFETLATSLHKTNVWLIGLLVATHIGAIAFYKLVKKDDLIRPMLDGRKSVPEAVPDPQPGRPAAFVIALAVAAVVGWLAAGGIAKHLAPPPPPPAETPNW